MRLSLFLFLTTLLLTSLPGQAKAQKPVDFDPLKDDISNLMPPLAALIDSALFNNPSVRYRDLQIIINRCNLKSSQYEWTRNLGVQADLRYGNLYNYTSNVGGGAQPPATATTSAQTTYSGAVFLNMPIHTAVSRKNEIKKAQSEVEQAQSLAEAQRNETRQLVIRQYNDVILKQRLLRIKSRNLETAGINIQMVEKEFSNGVVSVTEYARVTEIQSRAESDYENSRTDFLTAFMILQEMVGINFHLINQKPGTNDHN